MPADYDAQLYQETIDAVRLILGMKPLYRQEKFSAVQRWGAELGESASVHYNKTRFAMANHKGHHRNKE